MIKNKTNKSSDKGVKLKPIMLSDVVGQDEAIKQMKELLFALQKKEITDLWKVQPSKGILLTGPPGTGKTMVARALCNELGDDITFFELKLKDVESRWVGGRVEKLSNFLAGVNAASENSHVILFIDELESLMPVRNENLHHSAVERLNVFLEWIDGGIIPLTNITLIGTTNCIHLIDPAAKRPGRFDRIIEFKPLNADAIIQGFKVHLNLKQLNDNQIGEINWDKVKDSIRDGQLSGAALPNILDRVLIQKALEHSNKVDLAKNGGKKINSNDISFYPKPISTEDILNQINVFLQSPQ